MNATTTSTPHHVVSFQDAVDETEARYTAAMEWLDGLDSAVRSAVLAEVFATTEVKLSAPVVKSP